MMEITLNGEAFQHKDKLTVQSLIDSQDLSGKRIAVEVNLEIIPRSRFSSHILHNGDRVEIVHAIGGG